MRAYCYGLCALCAACSVHFGECALCSEQCALWRMCATARAAQCSVRWHSPSGQLLPTLTLQRRVTASSCSLQFSCRLDKCEFEWSDRTEQSVMWHVMFPVVQVDWKKCSIWEIGSESTGWNCAKWWIQFETPNHLISSCTAEQSSNLKGSLHWWQKCHERRIALGATEAGCQNMCQTIPALSWSHWVLHISCHWMC